MERFLIPLLVSTSWVTAQFNVTTVDEKRRILSCGAALVLTVVGSLTALLLGMARTLVNVTVVGPFRLKLTSVYLT